MKLNNTESTETFGVPSSRVKRAKKAVLVHAGARDGYQLARALAEADLLDKLVTDFFWSDEDGSHAIWRSLLPECILKFLHKRSAEGVPAQAVISCLRTSLGGFLLDKQTWLPFSFRQRCVRAADAVLGRSAGELARKHNSALVSYSYTGYDAFREFGRGGLLFQVHPHPLTMRRILREELARSPECACSLKQEWELSLPEGDFDRLVQESAMATSYLAASSFTRASLIENGADPKSITVVPYGVDLHRFRPAPDKSLSRTPKLRLLFVGRINQRKGLKYLLEALRLLQDSPVELMICGRVLDDLSLFEPFRNQVEIRGSVSNEDLVRAYQSADMFVFPSLGEGFGQVLLEALACGLPILSTTNTAAPDLIENGREGFIVEPCQPGQLADRIDWAVHHRRELAEMNDAARARAMQFSWARFRSSASEAVRQFLMLSGSADEPQETQNV